VRRAVAEVVDPKARAWVYSTVTLSVGALVLVAVVAPPQSASPARGLAWLLFLGSSVHVASSGWLYTLPDIRALAIRHPKRYVVMPLALVALAAGLAVLLTPSELTWLLLPYFAWQFFHFQKQNVGMAALAASSSKVLSVHPLERKTLICAGVAGITGLLARPHLLQLPVDPGTGALFPLAAAAFVCSVGVGIVAFFRRPRSQRPFVLCAVFITSLLFSLPVFVFRSPYAAVGGMTIAHGLQYLLLIGLVASSGRRPARRLVRIGLFVNIALIGGLLLSLASHLHGSNPVGRLAFGAYLGVVMAHFVIDAGLWRLSEPDTRKFMGRHLPYLCPTHSDVSTRLVDDRSSADIA
jgi:hypothetical protein